MLFNPAGTGAGGALTIDLLDPTVGDSLTFAPNGLGVGATVSVYFQANLGISSLGGVGNFLNGTSGENFTFAGSFTETVLTNDGAGHLTFGLGAGTNVLNMYENSAPGNNLTGNCFTCGTLVLSANLASGRRAGLMFPAGDWELLSTRARRRRTATITRRLAASREMARLP